MINMEKAIEEFIKYVEEFDLNEKPIKMKKEHSLRVMEISNRIAIDLGLEKEKIELATLIGLLHDIARFEQYKQFKTFSDIRSFDHGDYGVLLLEKDDMIRKYIGTDKYDNIIKKAIKNHNKFSIEDGLSEEEILFSKIIRDADKLDIFYEAVTMFWENDIEKIENGQVRPEIKEHFLEGKLINKKDVSMKDGAEKIIQVLAFVYDMNFDTSFKMLYENKYIDRIIGKFDFKIQDTKEDFEEIRNVANRYVEKRLNIKN